MSKVTGWQKNHLCFDIHATSGGRQRNYSIDVSYTDPPQKERRPPHIVKTEPEKYVVVRDTFKLYFFTSAYRS